MGARTGGGPNRQPAPWPERTPGYTWSERPLLPWPGRVCAAALSEWPITNPHPASAAPLAAVFLTMWLPLMLVSFVSFLGTMFAFIWLGCTPSGTVKRRGWAWLAAAALSLSLWLLSLPRIPPPYSLEILKHYVTPPVE